jgi:hypothetical protein
MDARRPCRRRPLSPTPSSWRSFRRFVSNSAKTPSMSRKPLPAAVPKNGEGATGWVIGEDEAGHAGRHQRMRGAATRIAIPTGTASSALRRGPGGEGWGKAIPACAVAPGMELRRPSICRGRLSMVQSETDWVFREVTAGRAGRHRWRSSACFTPNVGLIRRWTAAGGPARNA